uniref:Uncharacterized protein n=1 Tax=Anguilla anguilla TaxID=7936 RepID=A0A0E9VE61_ANGAN
MRGIFQCSFINSALEVFCFW